MELNITLPEPVFQRLRSISESTNQSLNDLAIQSIAGNLPPEIESAPSEMREELSQLQLLSIEALRQLASSQIPKAQQEKYIALLEKNQNSLLAEIEQQELHGLRHQADRLMLKKAHACAILRWRGSGIQTLNQLSPT